MGWWRDPGARAGAVLLLLLAAAAVGAPFLAPYSPRIQDRSGFYQTPSLPGESCRVRWWARDGSGKVHLFGFENCRVYLLGTDGLGRDVLSRLLYGARWTVGAAALGVALIVALGTAVGASAGFLGGNWDRLLMRLTDLVMALPALYLVLALRSIFPDQLSAWQSYLILVGSLTVVGWCGLSRLLRAQVLSLRERDFVASAVAAGASRARLLFCHILPNVLPFVLLQAGLALPHFMLGEAALSFLGLGLQEPEPSWGNMLGAAAGSYSTLTAHWWTLAAPGGALTLAVLGANLWIEGLRRAYLAGGGWASKQRRQRAS